MSDGASAVYTGAAEFGRFSAVVSGIIGTLIALIIAGVGIYLLVEATRRTSSVGGTVIQSTCTNTTADQPQVCKITVEYTSNQPSRMCMRAFTVQNRPIYEKGKKVTIFYDPSDPCGSGSLESRTNDSILGIGLVVGAVVFIVIVWLVVWLTQKFKFFAAAEGVGTVIRLV